MESVAFMAVLFAAILHASWNAVVKVGLDRFLTLSLIFLCSGAVSLAMTPFVGLPGGPSWPWLLVSVVLHTGYMLFLVRAYNAGDMGQVYPIARGTAPLLVTVVMSVLFGETLSVTALSGVITLVAGVFLMSTRGGKHARLERSAVMYALGTSLFIAGYTVVDGLGARAGHTPNAYAVWLFLLDAVAIPPILLYRRGLAGFRAMGPYWRSGLAGGCMALGGYWIVLWAMTVGPIAMVAALRESSVLFAAVISVVVLRESLTRWRAFSAVIIVIGIVMARIG